MKIEVDTNKYKTVIVGYSGGVDSQVLLTLLKNIKNINIVAMHVNHNIDENSYEWESFCKNGENETNVKVLTKSIFLGEDGNLENKAREERYKFFKEEYDKYEVGTVALMTGHHLNDQAETFLLKLMRGSGLEGLSGILPESKLFGMTVLRPLLSYTKEEIYDYAGENNLKWVEDPSNKSLEYDRNFMRNQVIPLLEKRWNKSVNMIGKSVNIIQETRLFEKTALKEMYKVDENGWIDVRTIKDLNNSIKKMIVREWIKEEIEMSPDGHLVNAVVDQCINKAPHNSGKIIKKFFTIKKENHMIKIVK
jgi:tRNA(Ile)-lysidine synthase